MRSSGVAMIVLASALLLGGEAERAGADARKRVPPFSVWIGSYTCPQGITSMRLSIEARASGDAVATFEFGPHPDNRSLPRGEYLMTGTVRALPRGHLLVRLVPDRWITQPDGWSMVSLTAMSDLEQRELEGRIESAACGALSARREDAS